MPRPKVLVSAADAMPSNGKPTLKTIAQMSGLAVPTISRALNDAPDIGNSTKELVRKIAAEIGYVPNRAGVRLRTGRTNVISLVMSTEHDNLTSRLISSVARGLTGTRFHLNVTPHAIDNDHMKPIRYLVETGSADAIIFNQIEPEDERVAFLMERNFPFATHGRSKWADKHAYYDFDNGAYGRLAVQKLHERGRDNLIAVVPPVNQNYCLNMMAGMQEGTTANNQNLHILEGVTSDDDTETLILALRDYLTAHPQTNGIICASTAAAMAAVAALENNGMVVGREIDVLAKEVAPFLSLFRSNIVTVSEAVGDAGDFLAKAAIQAIRDPDLPPMQFVEVPQID